MHLPAGLNFGQIIARVAERVANTSYASGDAGPPSDEAGLNRIKRAVNDGLSRIASANPNWRALWPTVELTLDPTGINGLNGDPTMYALPARIQSGPISAWSWSLGVGYSGIALDSDIDSVRRLNGTIVAAGRPTRVACDIYHPANSADGNNRPRWFAQVHPQPDGAYVMKARFRIVPYTLVENDDFHAFGAGFDQLVIAAAVMVYRAGGPQADAATVEYANLLSEARALNGSTNPRNLGQVGDPSMDNDSAYLPGANISPVLLDGVQIS